MFHRFLNVLLELINTLVSIYKNLPSKNADSITGTIKLNLVAIQSGFPQSPSHLFSNYLLLSRLRGRVLFNSCSFVNQPDH